MKRGLLIVTSIVALAAVFAWQLVSPTESDNQASSAPALSLPALSGAALQGQVLFNANCARCHGVNGSGSDMGPPLIHKIYEPSHHADFAFHRAVEYGVRAHHWRFGNMPAVPGLSETDVDAIIAFVRAVQRENGIN